ncbi:MAG TPA: response regulator transcription factor [Pirellulales bacterium]|nr:response regulator transcription factor [Pirellulales bacterium]
MSIALLIADDQEVVRAGLARWLAGEIKIVGEAATIEDLSRLADSCGPQVVLSEIRLSGADALQTLALVKQRHPTIATIVFSTDESPRSAARALAAEVCGYLLKGLDREGLLAAIRSAAAGQRLWRADELRRLHRAMGPRSGNGESEIVFTRREADVLEHMAKGLTNKEIAEQLGISSETVKEHVQHLLRKVGVRDRTQAAVWLVRQQISQPGSTP